MKNIFIFIIASIVLAGCASKSFDESFDEKAKERINPKVYDKVKTSYSQTLVNEQKVKKDYVNIDEDKYLSSVLKELEAIENIIYFLKGDDILIPKSLVQIDSFAKLDSYLQAVSNKRLVQTKLSDLTLVRYEDVSEIKKEELQKIAFNFEGEIVTSEFVKLLKEYSKYNISFGAYLNTKKDFFNNFIYLKASNLLEAINQFASSNNLYVDINYEQKVIKYHKYKDVVIELNIPMLNLRTSNNAVTSVNDTDSKSTVENKSTIYLYDELKQILTNIKGEDTTASFHLDQSSGLIYLKATKSMEEAARNVVKAYEESYAKEAIIEFERLELLLNKDQVYGIASLGADGQNKDVTGSLVSYDGSSPNFSLTNIGDGTSLSLRRITDITAKANYQIGYVLNYSKNLMVLKNNIPAVQSISQNTDYIEQIEKTVSENNSISTQATVNTIKDGTTITARAKVLRDRIFLNITPSIKKFIKFNSTVFEQSTIQLPEYKDQSYNISREIGLGETLIVGSIIVHDDTKEYEGLIPLEGFAIGGADSKSYVRREIVYVVTLRSVKGF